MPGPLTLLAAVLVVLGLFAAGTGLLRLSASRGSSWEEQRGTVTGHASVEKEVTVGGRSATRSRKTYTRVTIAYEASGQRHTLDADRAPPLAVSDFPVGKSVPVFVNRARPSEATLDPAGAAILPFLLLAAGTLLLVAGAVFFLLGRRT